MDEWENGLSDEYEQEESSELQRELALERETALDLEIERDEQRSRTKPEPPAMKETSFVYQGKRGFFLHFGRKTGKLQ